MVWSPRAINGRYICCTSCFLCDLAQNPKGLDLPFDPDNTHRVCNTDEDTVQCQNKVGSFPMCIRQFDSTRQTDIDIVTAHLQTKNPPESIETYTQTSACTGRYQYYECDLSEMVNGLGKLVNDVLNIDPSGIFKKIIFTLTSEETSGAF